MDKQVRKYNDYRIDMIECDKDYYTWVDDALVKVIPIELLYNYDKETDKYYTRIVVKCPNDKTVAVEFKDLYNSIPMFEQGLSIKPQSVEVTSVIHEMSNRIISFDTGEYWSFIKGEPKKQFFRLDTFSYKLNFKYRSRWQSPDYDAIKDNCYNSKSECLKFNSYKYTTSENKTYIKVGCNKAIMLDNEQKVLINKLESLLKEIKDNDIKLVFDATENIYAYNLKNLEDYDFSYDSSDCSFTDDVTEDMITNRLNDCYKIDSNIEYYGEDYSLLIWTKDKRITE